MQATRIILQEELAWLVHYIQYRIANDQEKKRSETENQVSSEKNEKPVLPVSPVFEKYHEQSEYNNFVKKYNLNEEERLILMLALAPFMKPGILELFLNDKDVFRRSKVYTSPSGLCLLPTIETALFLLAREEDIEDRERIRKYFSTQHLFYKLSVLEIGDTREGEPDSYGILSLNTSFRDLFINNEYKPPRFSQEFPATLLETNLDWNDLVLEPLTASEINELRARLKYQESLAEFSSLTKHIPKGLRILLYGDPGTGKTLTATLLGKMLNQPVYRVDISGVTSKYVGESMNRLRSLFNLAENKNWILFLDEGDALLGKRSSSSNNSNVHYANQDVAFLLQRIEQYQGIIVVATNFSDQLDDAFDRRFQAKIKFRNPEVNQQVEFFKKCIPEDFQLDNPQQLERLLTRFRCSPAEIVHMTVRSIVLAKDRGLNYIPSDIMEKVLMTEVYKAEEKKAIGRMLKK